MNSENKPVLLVDKSEEDQVSRNMVIWANTFPYLPDDLSGDVAINFEYLLIIIVAFAVKNAESVRGVHFCTDDFAVAVRLGAGDKSVFMIDFDIIVFCVLFYGIFQIGFNFDNLR